MRAAAGILAACAAALLFAGCPAEQRYHAPAVAAPPEWKTPAPWRQAAPADALPREGWWRIFQDDVLNGYEQKLQQGNFTLQAAQDRLQQARSLARVTTAGFFPQASVDPGGLRERISGNRLANGSTAPLYPVNQGQLQIPFSISYEADLFGRNRAKLAAANASLQASAADAENVRLILSAELAAEYFQLRSLDEELAVVAGSVESQKKALQLVESRHEGGLANGLEVAQQKTVLDTSVTQLALLRGERAGREHSIAVLLGEPPSSFSLPAAKDAAVAPAIPLGAPSDLLERRPDIAEAERAMAYQNAQSGLARAAFYPQINLGFSGGYQSTDLRSLADAPSAIWAIGADIMQPLFTGGRNRANLAASRAAYEESVAGYRQAVLVAMQQVEDALASLSAIDEAEKSQQAAVADAQKSLQIATNRYQGGVSDYLDVVTAQTALLASQRQAVELQGQRMTATVYLIKALGGGWSRTAINGQQIHPEKKQILAR
jgi:NodT family efflux transporter outer membrane factor (OMF) lipoprotein